MNARIFTENTDPLDIFLQTRPFPGSLPRRVSFWTTTDRQQQQVLRVDTQPTAQALPQRHTERTHHQIESAQECKVCTLWYRKLNKQWICLMMCRVPFSLLSQTCTPSCVAWCTLPGCFPFCTHMQMIMTNRMVLVTCFCSNMGCPFSHLTAGRSTMHAGSGVSLS